MAELYNHNPYSLTLGPFGPECFSVTGFSTHNFAFNQNYRCLIYFRCREKIDLSEILYQTAVLNWQDNYIHGIVTEIYPDSVHMLSPLYLLAITQHSRVYADMNFEKLITTVINNKLEVRFLFKDNYPVLKYTAQYHETDLEFIQRQCSRWGIFWGFIQQKDRAVLVFSDDSIKFAQYFPDVDIAFETLSEYKISRKLLHKTVRINDYNPETPELSLEMEIQSSEIGLGCDDRPYEFYQTQDLGEKILKKRLEYYDCRREIILAQTDNLNLKVGQRINTEHDFYISQCDFCVNILKNQKHVNLKLMPVNKTYRPELPQLFYMPDCTAHIISDSVDEAGRYYISPDYDERKENNTYPVRLLQPCTGDNIGFHFPVIKNTKVLLTHINGDPDRPVILGVMPCEEQPSWVTSENNLHHVLQTPKGNRWFMDDDPDKASLKFNTTDDQAILTLLADQINLSASKDIVVDAAQHIFQKTDASYIRDILGSHNITIKNNYVINTDKSGIALSSGKDLILNAELTCFNISKNIIIHGDKNIDVSGKKAVFISDQAELKSADQLNITASALVAKSLSKVIITVGGASITISDSEITITATSVNFNTASFISPQPQLGSSATEAVKNNIGFTSFGLNYIHLDNRYAAYTLHQAGELMWSGMVREKNHLCNLDISQQLDVIHKGLPVISVDQKPQKPSEKYHLQPVLNKQHEIIALKKAIYKKIAKLNNQFKCELLSESELNYFRNFNRNNIVLFIHGYNVPAGHAGEYGYIRTPDEGFHDDRVNGTGAHNWLLHMEYNLNCAAKNSYLEFPWENDAIEYKRIVGIHWPGYQKIHHIPYSSGLNFAGMEFNAIETGYALMPLIKQLKSAGLTINIIAHSLGCLAAIQLMDLLGRAHQSVINNIVLWEPAVAKTALSPIVLNSVEQKRKAVRQTLEGEAGSLALPPLMLYEYYGEFLRQKAANFKHTPPWEVYEKDPFAYFPYAHFSATKIHVLYSHHDDVLKWDYRLNAIFADLPHYNLIQNPMGLYGPDDETLKLLQHKVVSTDQKDWLLGHSEMRIPIKSLFENIYSLIIKEIWTS